MGVSIFEEKQPVIQVTSWLIADGTNKLTVLNASAGIQRADQILMCNLGGTDRTAILYVNYSSADHELWRAVIPAGAGNGTVAMVDLLQPSTALLGAGLAVTAFPILKVALTAAVAADNDVHAVVLGGLL